MKREVVVCIEHTVEDSLHCLKWLSSQGAFRGLMGVETCIAQARQMRKMMRIVLGSGMTTNQRQVMAISSTRLGLCLQEWLN